MEYHSRHYIVTHPADDRKTEKRECKDKLPIYNKNRKFLGIITRFDTKYINPLYTSSESFINKFVHRLLETSPKFIINPSIVISATNINFKQQKGLQFP